MAKDLSVLILAVMGCEIHAFYWMLRFLSVETDSTLAIAASSRKDVPH